MDEYFDDESELFQAEVQDVRRLKHDRVEIARPRPAPIPTQRLADDRQVIDDMLSDEYHPDHLETGEELVFCRDGLQRRVLRKLRRGQYRLDSELDLHGLTVPLARQALVEFFMECRRRDLRCVRIIHGKGRRSSNRGPVLKSKVDHWLRQRDEVLAFCSALPMDGGTGAVYVLLRRLLP